MVTLVVSLAFVASDETRVLVMMLAMIAFVALFAGPWGLRFWRLAQPSLFVETDPQSTTTASAPTRHLAPDAGTELAPQAEPIAAD